MNILESLKMAIDSILSNKLRSFLTMLGIIIGISSVITIVSLGQGGQNTITGEFDKLGAATITLKVNASNAQPSDYFTLEDVKQIRDRVDTAKYVSPSVSKSGTAFGPKKNKRAMLSGGTADAYYISNVELVDGRYFNDRDVNAGKAVAVIDENSAKSLFGDSDVVGKELKVGPAASAKKVTIIGVSKGFGAIFGGGDESNMPVFIDVPVTFLQTLYPNDFNIDSISVLSTSKEESESTGNSVRNILESRHMNRGKDVYQAQNAMRQLDQINKVLGIFTAFIGAVAAISLLVGGIGVMNIMLVSVTERTREIGIRKAIGATTQAILLQFLTESIIISLIGGIIGMILGILGASAIGSFANITPSLSIGVVLGAIGFSSAVGIFFGIYPARKAAKLDPIEALRYE